MTFHNRTRSSVSISRRLRSEGAWYLLPFYGLLRLSALGREGIEHGGSYRFADHIYAGRAKGRFGIGRVLDRIILSLPSVRAFRSRYTITKELIDTRADTLRVLAIPSGFAREVYESKTPMKATYVDLDPELIEAMRADPRYEHTDPTFIVGDAFDERTYASMDRFDMIICLGLFEFIDDDRAVRFLKQACTVLDGELVVSGMKRHRLSDWLLRTFAELKTRYRTREELVELARRAGYEDIKTIQDETGYQTVMVLRWNHSKR